MGEDAAALAALRARLDRRHRAELAAITAELERERGSLSQMLIDQGLASALSRAGVAPALVAGAAALLRPMMAVTGEGTARGLTARLPDGSNRPLTDFITDWAAGDGAAYLAAPDSHGGGGRPDMTGAPRRRRRADLGGPAERARFIREHGRSAYLELDP
ncbi:hypothetical protein GCM10011505_35760 [Tistrella bauzanensis]|uniref:Uncharacterized protein n=2 Tax=Tistrella bauzanensis TaxID=657419 RepID=A0ABQ1IVH9_9PROT|nr:hypothetical protein GCM10011505_35760 [Tistrella bauzanensis]